ESGCFASLAMTGGAEYVVHTSVCIRVAMCVIPVQAGIQYTVDAASCRIQAAGCHFYALAIPYVRI
ncbi:MAG TPA: hypothetical protein PLC40_06075, partial [Candidatus Hydrogenedentes bacterium]|nr:hypothetical protein [Candidatus Hydrogenedentota bacterium]